MTMPWTMDALLPRIPRYTSRKFRRVFKSFRATDLDSADATELVAFVGTVGLKAATWIFQWTDVGVREAKRLIDHIPVHDLVEENSALATRADGLACLDAMKDGGWTKGPVPGIVRMAFLDMRASGQSVPRIAREVGLTVDQVRVMANGLRKPSARRFVRVADLVAG